MPLVLRSLFLNYTLVLILGVYFLSVYGSVDVDPGSYLNVRSIVARVLVLPFVETVIFQMAIIELFYYAGRKLHPLKANRLIWPGAALCAFVFATAHFVMNGAFNGFVFGISGGVTLSLVYAINRKVSRQVAFATTWLAHLLLNGLFFLSFAFFELVFVG